jgi:predicted component of type VI protein secretion system
VVQLQFLSGTLAGQRCDVRQFPFRIGRSSEAHLSLQDDGIWDSHCSIEIDSTQGAVLRASSEAFLAVNGQPTSESALRNGDVIDAGSVKMRFGLTPTLQRSLRWREALTWIGLGALCLGQVALFYWLMA